MAKKKQKKAKDKFEYSNEIVGVLLILLSIIGMLGYGRAGNFIRGFSVFLVGVAYFPLLAIFLILGVCLIVKRSAPKLISREMIGASLLVMAVLTVVHIKYVVEIDSSKMIVETFKNIMLSFKSPEIIKSCGGGMIGAILSYIFNWAFSADGIVIVVITLAILGIILIFNASIINWFKGFKIPRHEKEIDDEDDEEESKEEVEDKRIVISSIEELTNKKEEADADVPIK